jgi:tetratricopeptide (TPR) repeat protein
MVTSSVLTKIGFSVLSKIAEFAFEKTMESVSRNEKIVHLLKKCGVSIRPENEFESIYAHTLVKYSVECKNKNFADFFAKKEIWEAFRMKFSSNYDEFEDRINTYLNIGDDRFMKIRSDGYRNVDDLKIEIERFSKIFDETIKEAMKPSEVKLQDSQDLISKKLDSVMDLLQVKNNIDISGEFLKKSKELLDQKEYDKARIWLEEFNKTHLDSNEKKWKYFNNLGVAYIGVGNQEKAADYLIEALKYILTIRMLWKMQHSDTI